MEKLYDRVASVHTSTHREISRENMRERDFAQFHDERALIKRIQCYVIAYSISTHTIYGCSGD